MKRFEFRLEKLLKLRRQIQHQAELQVQQASVQAESAKSELASIQKQLFRALQVVDVGVGELVDVDARVHVFRYLDRMNDLLENAERKASAAEQQRLAADTYRKTAKTDTEALKTLRMQKENDHQQQATRKFQDQMDEVAIQRWIGPKTRSVES